MTEGRRKDVRREGVREGGRKDGVIRRWSMVEFEEIDFSVG